ncbi:MAG: flagellar biosynthesis protein FlgI, partial [Sphingomonas sp.]
ADLMRTAPLMTTVPVRALTITLAAASAGFTGRFSIRLISVVRASAPFSQGQTAKQNQSNVSVTEEHRPMFRVKETANLADIVKAVNAIGASPADLVAILEALKQAGAMTADLVIL